jgi:hypothetical protein
MNTRHKTYPGNSLERLIRGGIVVRSLLLAVLLSLVFGAFLP